MKQDRICSHCGKKFEAIEGRVFSNHVRWCPENTTNGDKGKSAVSSGLRKSIEERFGPVKIACCPTCKKEFIGSHTAIGTYCSKSCANKLRKYTDETRNKISKSLKGRRRLTENIVKSCPFCGKEFSLTRKYCSDLCLKLSKQQHLSDYQKYRKSCYFNFNLADYPDRFDFDLIKKHGWYAAKNRGNNPNGISRDHKFSISDGWKFKVPTWMISHPANCELMQHIDNRKKQSKSSITLEELNQRISNW